MIKDWTTSENQQEATLLLKEYGSRHIVGNQTPGFPEPFFVRVDAHSTGCQATIWLQAPGVSSVKVWEGSVWYSSCYEFNDRGKTLGLNPDCQFAKESVNLGFRHIAALIQSRTKRKQEEVEEDVRRNEEDYRKAVDHFRGMF